jgi:hypothetical protein
VAAPDPLLRHICHAEGWLRRARLDWRRGNAPAAMLRLMLAEAEIRHARETGPALTGPRDARSTPAPLRPRALGSVREATAVPIPEGRSRANAHGTGVARTAAAVAAAAVLAAGLGYASQWQGLPRRHALVPVPGRNGAAQELGAGMQRTIVRLDSGEFLMPDRGRIPSGGPSDPTRPQFAVPVDLRTPSPTF